MLEFIAYLSPIGREIISEIAAAKFRLRENVGICSQYSVYGHLSPEKQFVICTENIRTARILYADIGATINETVYHEAVHAAQICRGKPLGIPRSQMALSLQKKANLQNSLKVVRESHSQATRRLEHEAYWMEDKPETVLYYLRKSCSQRQ